jgi:DNA-directed RNA polymerase subunit M/transcription elongation factor TFIIS
MTNFDEIRQNMDLLSDEELVSILQEHDEEQWRPEVFDIVKSILHGRGISSVDEDLRTGAEETEWRILDETTRRDLVTVGTYSLYADAETDRMALEADGLKAWIFNQYGPPTGGFAPAVQLKVLAEDFPAAMKILETEAVDSSDLPAEFAVPPCPRCGAGQVIEEGEIVESAEDRTPKQEWFYSCTSCGHKWPCP